MSDINEDGWLSAELDTRAAEDKAHDDAVRLFPAATRRLAEYAEMIAERDETIRSLRSRVEELENSAGSSNAPAPSRNGPAVTQVWNYAEENLPNDVRQFADRHKLSEYIPALWRSAFVSGWNLARVTADPVAEQTERELEPITPLQDVEGER